ncbi:MAG: hypothetical protein ACFHXK_06650 [bacterium]
MSAQRCAAAITFLCLLSGCIPYKTPLLIPGNGQYPGLIQADDADVVLVHGMCTHAGSWAIESIDQMRVSLGMRFEDEPRIWWEHKGVQVWQATLSGDSHPTAVTAYAVVWSGVTEPHKKQLCYDAKTEQGKCETSPTAPSRAHLNSMLKSRLVSDCLSDAVLYMSEFGATIRERVALALMKIGDEGRSHPDNLYVITESLGSKILADVLAEYSARPSIRNALSAPAAVYMAANQIPLLDLGSTRSESGALESKSFPTVQKLRQGFEAVVGKKAADEIPFVLFSDPNDVLTYEFEKPLLDKYTTNVRIGAARNFWIFANPIQAHTGYLQRPWVWKEIVRGRPERSDDRNQQGK